MLERAKKHAKRAVSVAGGSTSLMLKAAPPMIGGFLAHYFVQLARDISGPPNPALKEDIKNGYSYVSGGPSIAYCAAWNWELARTIIVTKPWEYLDGGARFLLGMMITLELGLLMYTSLLLGHEKNTLAAAGSATLSAFLTLLVIEYLNSKSHAYENANRQQHPGNYRFMVVTEEGADSDLDEEAGIEMTQAVSSVSTDEKGFTTITFGSEDDDNDFTPTIHRMGK